MLIACRAIADLDGVLTRGGRPGDRASRARRQAFGDAEIAYAGKAFLCRAMVRWIDEEGLSLDVCSEGELAVASSAGFPADVAEPIAVFVALHLANDFRAAPARRRVKLVTSSRPWPSGVSIIAISARTPSSPTTGRSDVCAKA